MHLSGVVSCPGAAALRMCEEQPQQSLMREPNVELLGRLVNQLSEGSRMVQEQSSQTHDMRCKQQ
eukprot:8931723-Karenia_brevis.AAC.1